MMQCFKAQFYRFLYINLRLINRLRMLIIKRFTNRNKWASDSQKTNYEASVDRILKTEVNFRKFRRNFSYCEIVENVTYRQGLAYINRIKDLDQGKLNFKVGNQNDTVGNPIQFNYPEFGKVSPTTLRYVSVSLEIQNIFGPELSGDFVEIGGGYGGQISILKDLFRIENYGIYDLPNVQNLIKRYLISINKGEHVQFLNLAKGTNKKWDIVISNYAFSELPKKLQKTYITEVLSKSRRGYLIMNSGRGNLTMRNKGKLNIEDLQKLLPSFEIFEEKPKTGPDNYVIIWGHKN
jgi:putative sugar O-methyltransferase